ncbi:MAG: hypothetical protein R3E83_12170 [Burkholderiaceae bacterium]
MTLLVDFARRLIGIRSRRAIEAPGPPPQAGSMLHFSGVRMRVSDTPSAEFWAWLVLMGWRECRYPGDRRQYEDLPESAFEALAVRNGASREAVYHQLMQTYHKED